jgi:hypothetical protein
VSDGDGRSDGLADGDDEGDGDGVGDGVGEGSAAALVGATSRSSAADKGRVRLGAAATSTERIPSEDRPTVTAVATTQATR